MLGLPPRLLANLADLNITDPTPIQTQAIPHALNGRDVMGLAQTGTGKTAAFGLPIVTTIMRDQSRPGPKQVHGLILAPTRELAKQIVDNLRAYSANTPVKIGLVTGGNSINGQINRLAKGTDLLVATPGRLIDLMEQKAVRLDATRFLVLDEIELKLLPVAVVWINGCEIGVRFVGAGITPNRTEIRRLTGRYYALPE